MTVEVHPFVDVDLEASECFAFAKGEAAVFSARKPDRDGANQDAAALIAVDDNAGVAVVADGAGGHAAGAEAAGLAVKAMTKAIEARESGETSLRTAILNGFEQANEAILKLGVGAATTLAVVEIQGNQMRTYHAGDSMILVTGQRGKVKVLSVPHSPVGYAVEAGLLHPDDALHHEDLHLVSNLLGRSDMRIEIGSALTLAQRDTVVLASDGLSDNLRLEEIVERVRKGSLKKAADRLASLGKTRMATDDNGTPSKPDDITFIALRLSRKRKARRRTTATEPRTL